MDVQHHAGFRDEVMRDARELVRDERDLFIKAGQQIDEIYSEELVRQDEDEIPLGPGERYAVEETFEGLRLLRLGVAAKCFRFPESHPDDNHFDFEGIGPIEDRKQAARMGILVMLAAADADKAQVITEEMGVLANIPYVIEGDGDLPAFGGSCWLSWIEKGWEDTNEPSPRVLKRLKSAIDFVRHGSLEAAQNSRVPSGDGRPCDKPGLNPHDELHRALRDLLRHVLVFDGNAAQWLETHQYDTGKELQQQRAWLLTNTRQWWETWIPAVKRVRDAIPNVQRSELKDFNAETLMALAKLNGIFYEPVGYLPHEQPGDHLLVRPLSVLGFQREDDRSLVSNYPRERVREAVGPIQRHLETLALFLDQEGEMHHIANPESIVEPSSKPAREMAKKPKRKRTRAEKVHDEAELALYLDDNPEATRDEAAAHMGLSGGTISNSPVWKSNRKKLKAARNEARPSQYEDFDQLADPESANIRSSDGGKAPALGSISASNARR